MPTPPLLTARPESSGFVRATSLNQPEPPPENSRATLQRSLQAEMSRVADHKPYPFNPDDLSPLAAEIVARADVDRNETPDFERLGLAGRLLDRQGWEHVSVFLESKGLPQVPHAVIDHPGPDLVSDLETAVHRALGATGENAVTRAERVAATVLRQQVDVQKLAEDLRALSRNGTLNLRSIREPLLLAALKHLGPVGWHELIGLSTTVVLPLFSDMPDGSSAATQVIKTIRKAQPNVKSFQISTDHLSGLILPPDTIDRRLRGGLSATDVRFRAPVDVKIMVVEGNATLHLKLAAFFDRILSATSKLDLQTCMNQCPWVSPAQTNYCQLRASVRLAVGDKPVADLMRQIEILKYLVDPDAQAQIGEILHLLTEMSDPGAPADANELGHSVHENSMRSKTAARHANWDWPRHVHERDGTLSLESIPAHALEAVEHLGQSDWCEWIGQNTAVVLPVFPGTPEQRDRNIAVATKVINEIRTCNPHVKSFSICHDQQEGIQVIDLLGLNLPGIEINVYLTGNHRPTQVVVHAPPGVPVKVIQEGNTPVKLLRISSYSKADVAKVQRGLHAAFGKIENAEFDADLDPCETALQEASKFLVPGPFFGVMLERCVLQVLSQRKGPTRKLVGRVDSFIAEPRTRPSAPAPQEFVHISRALHEAAKWR
jgi:hypothetical protein